MAQKNLPPASGQLIPRQDFNLAVQRERITAPSFSEIRGKTNPYTHRKILTEEDYDEYIREHAFHKLCEAHISQSLQIAQEQSVISSSKLQIAENRMRDALAGADKYKRRFSRLCTLIVAAALAFFLFALPKIKYNSFSSGEAAGYESGYSIGVSDGTADGYKSGYDDGTADGYRSGYNEGSSVRSYSSYYVYDSSAAATTPSTSSVSRGSMLANAQTEVYVSRNNKIHLRSNCSGMQYYTTMSYQTAFNAGYSHCSKCF